MTTTFTLPDGTKVRTRTSRRYVLIGQRAEGREPWVVMRSDKRATLADKRRRALGFTTAAFIGDTVTGDLRGA